MRLYTSGVKLPKLGSLQDRTLRSYLIKEANLEISKAKLTMLQTLVTPTFKDEQGRSSWVEKVGEVWNEFLSSVLLFEMPKESPKETALREYYDRVISKLRPTAIKDQKTGKVTVSGIDPKLL